MQISVQKKKLEDHHPIRIHSMQSMESQDILVKIGIKDNIAVTSSIDVLLYEYKVSLFLLGTNGLKSKQA